jgi:hypothetical protein
MDAAPWLTPSILNTITKAQPMIDVFNRTVFDQLGFHDSFVTRCFETRFVQHFLLPFCYVNAINAAKYFNRKVYGEANNKAMLLELFSKMVRNPEWAAALSAPPDGPGGGGALSTRAGTSYGGVRGHARVSIRGGPPSRESPCKHVLIQLKDIPGYKGFEPNPNPNPNPSPNPNPNPNLNPKPNPNPNPNQGQAAALLRVQ